MAEIPLIEQISISMLAVPTDDPVPMSFASMTERRTCLVEVFAGGLTGIGESWINYPPWAAAERMALFTQGVAPLVLGQDATDPAGLQRQLLEKLLPMGRQAGAPGPVWQAVSAVDVALWDLAGQLAGCPVHALLNGDSARVSVPAYASGVGPTAVEPLCNAALELGLTRVKAKVGFGHATDERTLTDIRAALPGDATVLADANQAWDPDTAYAVLPLLEDHRVGWIEEPLAGDHLADLVRLAEHTSIPIATGENVYGVGAFSRRATSGAIGYLQPDLAKCGGFTVGTEVAGSTRASGCRIAPHCYSSALGLLAALHLAAAWSHVSVLEVDVRANPLRTDLLADPLRWADGELVVPTGHGLGSTLATDVVDDLRTNHAQLTWRR